MKKDVRDLIDLKKVSELLEGFNKATGFVTAILDLEGNVLSQSGWREICTNFHRVNPKTSERCTISDTVLASKMKKGEKYHAYTCLNGLTDVAVPLEIGGEHVANLFSGQFFFKEPDIDFFRKQAKDYGFDEVKYSAALKKVPVVSEEKVKTVMDFLLQMTDLISELGFEKAEQAELNKNLKESENKYRTIFSSTGTVTMLVRNNTYIEMSNNQAEKVTGYTEEELTGSKWTDHVAPHSLEKMMHYHKIRRSNPEKAPSQYEVDLIHKSGEIRRSLLSIGMIPNSELSIVTLIDITERKVAEKALEDKTEQLETIIKGANIGWWDWDIPSGDEIYNEILTENLGYKLSEVVAHVKWWKDKIHPDDAKQVYADLQEHFTNKTEFYQNKHRLKTKNGQWKWFQDFGKVVERDKNGNPIRMIGTLRDIDFEERAWQKIIVQNQEYEALNEELRHTNENLYTVIQREEAINDRFNKAMEATSEGLFDWNLITNEIYYSPGWKSMLGYKEEELPNDFSIWEQLTDSEDVKRSWDMLNALIEGKKEKFDIEFKMKHKKGYWVDLHSRANVFRNHEGKAIRVVGTHTDITERKKVEKELLSAKEKAEESDRLKSAFLANMSHEIRTPMNGILAFTSLLKKPQLTGDKKDKYIQIIEKSGQRMLSTINDIVDISKIEAGQVKVEKTHGLVNDLMKEQYDFFYREASKKGLKLLYNPALPDSESDIITDWHKLQGILTNLIKNAIKFTETGKVEFGYNAKNEKNRATLEFYVSDTGIGIAQDRIEAIFNRFEQADIEDKKAYEGTGLGLAISLSYVEMLGGKIKVNSKEGSGSIFTFSIPYIKTSNNQQI